MLPVDAKNCKICGSRKTKHESGICSVCRRRKKLARVYRIFLHFKSGTLTEVERGENPALPVRIIRENMSLEAPLLAGLLGKLTE